MNFQLLVLMSLWMSNTDPDSKIGRIRLNVCKSTYAGYVQIHQTGAWIIHVTL